MLAHGFGELLSNDVVAQLFLVFHYSEIVIVAGTEQAVRENLIVSAATGYHPDRSTTGGELVLPNFSSLHKPERLLEPFLEYSHQRLLLFFGERSSPDYFLTGPL